MTQRQRHNLHDRIRADVRAAIDHRVAAIIRVRGRVRVPPERALHLADDAESLASSILDRLLVHYTVRERRR